MSYYVYKHTAPNGKVYIGITRNDPWIRWSNGHGYKDNKPFFNDIILYGWLNIKHEILYEGLTQREAEDKEIELIILHDSDKKEHGYNRTSGGLNGYDLSDYVIKEIRAIRKEQCKTNKEVYQYTKENQFICKWFSRKEAERVTGISQYGIKDCVNGKRKSYKGFIWSYTPPGTIKK